MNFKNCLFAENIKGRYIIVVNEPDDSPCSGFVKFESVDNSVYVQAMTDSVYIGKTNKQILLYATYALNSKSQSEYIKIEPDMCTKIEVNYDYCIYNGQRCVNKVILTQTEYKPPISI